MTARFRAAALLLSLTGAGACASEQAEEYGFIATLGNDTTSVERVVRTGDRVVGDAVGRSPLVVRRHWEATLAPDGTIRSWEMDTHVMNGAPGEQHLHHEAEFLADRVRVIRATSRDTTDVAYARKYEVTVPWNAFLYASWEMLFQAARGRPDTTHIGQYFFEGWAEGQVGFAQVRALGDGRVSITSTGLSGAGVAQLDEAGRMLAYSGAGTTYRQEVTRVATVPDIDAVAARFAADEREKGVARALSVRDTVRATIGATDFVVEYSRPLARGRILVGGLIPHDRVWRTGANAATHFTTSQPVRIAGIELDAGSYTLWTLPATDGVSLIINRQTGQWGTGYQAQHDVARVAMQVDTTSSNVEQFTIRIEPSADAGSGRLILEWGDFSWSVPLVTDSP